MQVTDEQVWADLERFALAMKCGAVVYFKNGENTVTCGTPMVCFTARMIQLSGGIREIIEPPQKKIRPLNAEEWRGVEGCIIDPRNFAGFNFVPFQWSVDWNDFRKTAATAKATCHPPGFPADVRKLWVEE